MVSFDTPLDILHEFRTLLRQFVADHPRDWKGGLVLFFLFFTFVSVVEMVNCIPNILFCSQTGRQH